VQGLLGGKAKTVDKRLFDTPANAKKYLRYLETVSGAYI